ncbi:MAG: hypothetical protein ABI663_09125 [Chryseolinea sp.]
MTIRFVMLIAVSALFFTSCNSSKSDNSSSVDSVNNVLKTKYSNGAPRAEIPYKNGKRNGKATEFYLTGKVFQETDYVNGMKHGFARKYYEDGVLLQETSYDSNRVQGIQKKYRKDGMLASEAPYFHGAECIGLKEYFLNGTLKEEYPTIVIRPEDYLYSQKEYRLVLTMSEKLKDVTYYEGDLTDDKYIGGNMKEIAFSEDQPDQAQLSFFVQPGESLKKTVNIVAKFKTVQGNYYITQRKYNFSIRNR